MSLGQEDLNDNQDPGENQDLNDNEYWKLVELVRAQGQKFGSNWIKLKISGDRFISLDEANVKLTERVGSGVYSDEGSQGFEGDELELIGLVDRGQVHLYVSPERLQEHIDIVKGL
jgi:hypothetical protein